MKSAAYFYATGVGDTHDEVIADGRAKAAKMAGPDVSPAEMEIAGDYGIHTHKGSDSAYEGKTLHSSLCFTRTSRPRYHCTECGCQVLESDRKTHTRYHHRQGEHGMCDHRITCCCHHHNCCGGWC